MRTRTDKGELFGPVRLLEILEFRFGAFQTIAYASLELAKQDRDDPPPMDEKTADAILEFADDLRQAYEAGRNGRSSGSRGTAHTSKRTRRAVCVGARLPGERSRTPSGYAGGASRRRYYTTLAA